MMVPYGGFWWRVLAYIIDGIILQFAGGFVAALFGVGMILPLNALQSGQELIGMAAVSGMLGATFLLNWLYFAIMECSKLQATIGKLAVGVIVTDLAGDRLSFGRATGRYFAKFLSALIFGIGFVMAGLTERKQGLHDMVAGTLVWKTRDPRLTQRDEGIFA